MTFSFLERFIITSKNTKKKVEYRRCAKNVEAIEQELKTRDVVEHQRWDQRYGVVMSLIHDSSTIEWTKIFNATLIFNV